jgi:hypothetical protein
MWLMNKQTLGPHKASYLVGSKSCHGQKLCVSKAYHQIISKFEVMLRVAMQSLPYASSRRGGKYSNILVHIKL